MAASMSLEGLGSPNCWMTTLGGNQGIHSGGERRTGCRDLCSLRLVTSFLQASVFSSEKSSKIGWEPQADMLHSLRKEMSTDKVAGLQDQKSRKTGGGGVKAKSGRIGGNPLARLTLILLGWGPRCAFSRAPPRSPHCDLRGQSWSSPCFLGGKNQGMEAGRVHLMPVPNFRVCRRGTERGWQGSWS